VKTYAGNKCGKFCVQIFLHCIDIAIFALRYFILPHPVVTVTKNLTPTKLVTLTSTISQYHSHGLGEQKAYISQQPSNRQQPSVCSNYYLFYHLSTKN